MAESTPATVSTRLTILGSGDAFSGAGCNAAYALDSRVLVDCGAPVHALMPRVGLDVAAVELVLLTHFHADHTFMLPTFLGARGLDAVSPAPLTVIGPPGTREYVLRLLGTGYGGHLVGLIGESLPLRWHVMQDGDEARVGDCSVTAHAVVHSTGPSLAYAVRVGDGPVIGFSGDSTDCAGLRRTISECDVMVCECTGWDAPVEGGHLWRKEVESLVAEYSDTQFILSHVRTRGTIPGALIAHDLLSLDARAADQQAVETALTEPVSG